MYMSPDSSMHPGLLLYLPLCTVPWLRLHRAHMQHSPTWDVGVTEATWDSPLIHLQLQCVDFIYVTRYPANRSTARMFQRAHSVAHSRPANGGSKTASETLGKREHTAAVPTEAVCQKE